METVNSRTVFEGLKVGQWLNTPNGIFVVTEPYNDNTRCIRAAEVLFNEVDAEPYGRSDSSLMTFADLRNVEII